MKKFFVLLFLGCLSASTVAGWQEKRVAEKELQLGYERYISRDPGILFEIHHNRKFYDFPAETHRLTTLDLKNLDFPSIGREGISADAKTFLKVPESAEYLLELASDDGAILTIDGIKVLDNWGIHSFKSVKGKKFLAAGWHYLKIRYRNEKGPGGLKLAWGKKGEERRPIGGEDVYLPQNLSPNEEPLPGLLASERLALNQLRGCFVLGACLSALLLWRGRSLAALFGSGQTWAALVLFFLAFGLRWLYYAGHLELRVQGIIDGGDNNFFLTLPLRFVSHGEFISIKCGNLPLLIPLLGTLYKYFNFFPGLHYYALLMIFLGSLAVLLPWLLLRGTATGWAGLLAGLFLAGNPLLVEFKMPYVSSDPLGFFVFSLAVFFGVKALRDGGWGAHLAAGFCFALMPMGRTAFIVLAPILAVALVVLSPRRSRALTALSLFAALLLGYDYLAAQKLGGSYFLHYLRDAARATVVHRVLEPQPAEWWQLVAWLPRFSKLYLEMIFGGLVPVGGVVWKGIVAVFLAVAAAFTAFRLPRLFLFLAVAAGIYFGEIASYHAHERLAMPLVFLLAIVLALGLSAYKMKNRKIQILFVIFIVIGFWNAGVSAKNLWVEQSSNQKFLAWVKTQAPEKSILVTDSFADPWELHKNTALPVFYDVTLSQTLVVNRPVVPTTRVSFLREQSHIPPLEPALPPAPNFDTHRYVLDLLARQGFQFLIVQPRFAWQLEHFYFQNETQMAINPKDYALRKWVDYPRDPEKGIWILERQNTVIRQAVPFVPPKPPAQLARFLSPEN